jgi:hypothetical protein
LASAAEEEESVAAARGSLHHRVATACGNKFDQYSGEPIQSWIHPHYDRLEYLVAFREFHAATPSHFRIIRAGRGPPAPEEFRLRRPAIEAPLCLRAAIVHCLDDRPGDLLDARQDSLHHLFLLRPMRHVGEGVA